MKSRSRKRKKIPRFKEKYFQIKITYFSILKLITFFILIRINLKSQSAFNIKESSNINLNINYTKTNINLNINDKKEQSFNKTKIINEYLSSIPEKYKDSKNNERPRLEKYFSLKVLSKNLNESSDLKAKEELLEKFKGLSYSKNYSSLKAIFVLKPVHFGNGLVKLNNLIYYCEVLGYKNIYLNSEFNWFIKEPIITDKINIRIINKSEVNCLDNNILCFTLNQAYNILFYPINIKVEIRLNLIKDEIRRNLPQIKTDKNDLYIHIRSGSIFSWDFNPFYSQPPLCFYQKIINDFKFKKIYIIAEENNNPVINKIIEEYPNIIYEKNSLENDISSLTFAYNLVGSISSFVQGILKITDNLENYWEYDIYRMSEKFGHLHVDIYDFDKKFKIYKMKPSDIYKSEMFLWSKDENKLKLMIEDKCTYDFEIIEPNIKK